MEGETEGKKPDFEGFSRSCFSFSGFSTSVHFPCIYVTGRISVGEISGLIIYLFIN